MWDLLELKSRSKQTISTVEDLMAEIITDSWLREQIDLLVQLVKNEEIKLDNDSVSDNDRKRGKKVFRKLLKTIKLWSLWEISVPVNEVVLNLEQIVILLSIWINLWYWEKKELKWYNISVKKKKSWFKVFLEREENWEIIESKEIKKSHWSKLLWPVRIDSPEIYINYDKINSVLQQLYKWAHSERWNNCVDNVSQELWRVFQSAYKNLGKEAFPHNLNSSWFFVIPWWNMALDDDAKFIGNEYYFQPEVSEILRLQSKWKLPTVFKKETINLLRRNEIIFLLLDVSLSTEQFWSYKVLDIAANQAVDLYQKAMWQNVKVLILPYSSKVSGIHEKLDEFIFPQPMTNTHVAIRTAIDLFIKIKTLSKTKDIKDILNNIWEYFWYLEDSWMDEWIEFMRHFIPIWNKDFKTWKERASLDLSTVSNIDFSSCHIAAFTDWIPTNPGYTLEMADLVKTLGINFTQVVAAYDLWNAHDRIKKSVLQHVSGGRISDVDDYYRKFKELGERAGGNTTIINVNEQLAWWLVSMIDLSIWLANYKFIDSSWT